MRRTNVSELKARLSAFLAMVRKGETVVVCDRNTPIARLVPFSEPADDLHIAAPSRPSRELRSLRPIQLQQAIDLGQLLRESRDQR